MLTKGLRVPMFGLANSDSSHKAGYVPHNKSRVGTPPPKKKNKQKKNGEEASWVGKPIHTYVGS